MSGGGGGSERSRLVRLLRIVGAIVVAAGLALGLPARPGAQGGARTSTPSPNTARVTAILNRCVACHSGASPSGGLNLTTRALALKGGGMGAALTPGRPEASLLFKRVAAKQMPPGNPLTADEIESLRRWIAEGAAWGGPDGVQIAPPRAGLDWWSLQKPVRPALPKVRNTAWVRNPIDAFVLAELERRGLSPAPPADHATLVRRVYFDLLGVPPTPAERAAFLHDTSPNAYEKLIDRLLADPRYGERWGRHWLDVARFGESQGFERDIIRDHAWRYRDYVIQSFNADKPYTQFVKEQIAGDVLEPGVPEGIVATGFLVAGPWDEVGNMVTASSVLRLKVREEELEDMLSAVGQTFLGMTVNCARCHDHKFDPILQRDYYRLKAAFDGVRHGNRPLLTPAQAKTQEATAAQLRQQVAAQEEALAAIEQSARARAQQTLPSPPAASAAPVPFAKWTFETDARDECGHLDGMLMGGATVVNGRLRLNGSGAFLQTGLLPRPLREKTLEAWVRLPNLGQRGGGVLSVEVPNGGQFDSIVFGEREPGKWTAGSDFFFRTQDLAAPTETAAPDALVHMAVVYRADNSIAVYRNGVPYGAAYTPTGNNAALRSYPAQGAHILMGLRHTGAANGFFQGEIEEARLYDRALSAAEVAASFRAGFTHLAPEALERALTPDERVKCKALLAHLAALRQKLQDAEQPQMAYAANPQPPAPTFLLLRGDVEKPGERVTAGGLSAVRTESPEFGLSPDAPEGQRRLKLAEWIASPDNPLTARVMVNRLWHYHFGRGLVATPNDFGFNGERPTHPQLLDWLAVTFMSPECGWRLKPLHRLILLSNTYRQSSRLDARASAQDADDRYLWRYAPRRLEGEVVRDAMLCVSGQINYRRGGPSFRPFTEYVNNSHFYTLIDSPDPEFNRRTVYRINVNSAKSPLLESLDCPDPSTKTPRRTITTTALQALELMNSAFVLRQARCFAARVRAQAGPHLLAQVALAYSLAYGRDPTPAETQRALTLARSNGLESLCWALLNSSEFLYLT